MKPYPAYKPTGLKWLPEVPRGWDVLRCKNIFNVVNQRSTEGKEKLLSVSEHYGVIERSKADVTMFMAESYEGYKLCWPDDLVINSLWAWSYGMGFSHDHGIISTAYSVYRLKDKSRTIPAYYNYLIRGTDYHWEMRVRSKGLWKSRYQLSDDDFMSAPILIPPTDEQRAIISYLDGKTATLDRLIELKIRDIELLQEKKQAEVSYLVTHGLDKKVKMRDSGVAWVGEVPEGWRIDKLRHMLRPFSEKGHPDAQLLSVVREKGVIVRDRKNEEENHNFIPDDLSGYKFVRFGQFAMNKMKAWQGSYGVSEYEGIVSPAYFVFDLITDVLPRFFHLAIRSHFYVPFFARASDGIRVGQWDLSMARMKEIPFLIPPPEEQQAIVDYLDAETAKTDRAIAVVRRQIELLREYRMRLISDAVTGRIDLRKEAC